mmetsp:Transcript_26849/g.64736  ORF Transcript_26849/g.64736 Transcript_26849/m.64736 type:complete len:408 (+) Transcript_26849:1331-2554(+)
MCSQHDAADGAGTIAALHLQPLREGRPLHLLEVLTRARFDFGSTRHQPLWESDALDDLDARGLDGGDLSLIRGHELVDLLDAEPQQHVRAQLIQPSVVHPGDPLLLREEVVDGVAQLVACVVHQELEDFAQAVALLAGVDDQSRAALECGANALGDAVQQVRPARRGVGAENVRVAGLVVHPNDERERRVWNGGDGADDVDGEAIDGWEEELQVWTCYELREHAARLLVDDVAEGGLLALKAFGDFGQVPHGFNGRLGRGERAVLAQDLLVRNQLARGDCLLDLRQVEVRLGHSDRRADVERALGDALFKDILLYVPPRVKRDDLGHVEPRLERPDLLRRESVGEVGAETRRSVLHRESHRAVDRVRARVRANRVPLAWLAHRGDDGAALLRVACTPFDGLWVNAEV